MINWIQGDGGPHILIESRYLNIWKGESDEEFEKSSRFYEEACLIDEYIGELEIGTGKCIIINDDVPVSTWIANGNVGGTLVVGNYIGDGMNHDILEREINGILSHEYTDTGLTYQVVSMELYLFPACDFDREWHYDYFKFHLQPGKYRIGIIEEYLVHDSSFRLFQFAKTD